MKQVRPPLLTSEAVLTEAFYFLRDDGLDMDPLFRMLERAALLKVLTVDVNDFSTYRRNDRRVIPFIAPSAR
jgi:hypothetical protein